MLLQPSGQKKHTNIAIVSHDAKLDRKKYHFEIACYKNKVVDLRKGAETDLAEVLQTDEVFASVARGELATKADLLAVFGTIETRKICLEILSAGNLRVSEKEREHELEALTLEIVSAVASMVMTKDGIPLTAAQVTSALEEVGFKPKPCPARKRQEEHSKLQAREAVRLLEEGTNGRVQRVQSRLRVDFGVIPKQRLGSLGVIDGETVVAHPKLYRELVDEFGALAVELLDAKVYTKVDVPETRKPPTIVVDHEAVTVTQHSMAQTFTTQTVMSSTSPTASCQSCGGVKFPTTDDLRKHFRSGWHAFNKKRQVKGMEPLGRLEFECLPEDLKLGFQAVDY